MLRNVASRLSPVIRPYCSAMDREIARNIATQNIGRLTSVPRNHEKERDRDLAEEQIMPAFDNAKMIRDVLSENGRLIGFHNYQIIKEPIDGKCAYFKHLAVRAEDQNQGFGSQLFKHALEVCCKKDVQMVFLHITDITLVPYYQKFGFQVIRWPAEDWEEGSDHMRAGVMGKCLQPTGKARDFIRLRRRFYVQDFTSLMVVVTLLSLTALAKSV